MLPAFFKKDSFITGIVIGFLLPSVFFAFLYLIDIGVFRFFNAHIVTLPAYLFLLSIIANLFPIKYYFVNKTNDKTGRGILLVTFIWVLLFFVLFQ